MRRKTLVVGWDGASIDLVMRWVAAGHLPTLHKMMQAGSYATLLSTIPMHSPTAWTTFATGLNPGRHGIFDFVRREPGTYNFPLVHAGRIHQPPVWDYLGQAGKRVGVMNVPLTYPPRPVNGFMITGLGTPTNRPYTYPPELEPELAARGYRVNKVTAYRTGREDAVLDEIYQITHKRTETAEWLMQNREWDVFCLVYRNSDELSHFFWRYMDETHPLFDPAARPRYRTAIQDFYQLLDSHLQRLMDAAGPETDVVVMSDHGAGPLYKDVFLNELFLQKGWLYQKESTADQETGHRLLRRIGVTRNSVSNLLQALRLARLEAWIKSRLKGRINLLPKNDRPDMPGSVDWTKTKVYSIGYYGQVFINLKGREPAGIVEQGAEYEHLRDEVARALSALVDPDTGQQVVERIYRKEELYAGEYLNEAPDLILMLKEGKYTTRMGYEFADRGGQLMAAPATMENGSHRLEGILLASGPNIADNGKLPEQHIVDIMPTLLALQECNIPTGIDGHIIVDILREQYNKTTPEEIVKSSGGNGLTPADSPEWSAQDEADVEQRLRDLGYLG